jgi:hypothetical protein
MFGEPWPDAPVEVAKIVVMTPMPRQPPISKGMAIPER